MFCSNTGDTHTLTNDLVNILFNPTDATNHIFNFCIYGTIFLVIISCVCARVEKIINGSCYANDKTDFVTVLSGRSGEECGSCG
jgi:hypothetical protein